MENYTGLRVERTGQVPHPGQPVSPCAQTGRSTLTFESLDAAISSDLLGGSVQAGRKFFRCGPGLSRRVDQRLRRRHHHTGFDRPVQRRKDLAKISKGHGEDAKVAIRKARHECRDMLGEIKTDGGASEDDVERGMKKLEEIIQEAVAKVDEIIATKEKDIMTL